MSNKKFKIVTYNIEYAAKREKIVENIIQLAKGGVDIFCLQELINTPNEEFFVDKILHRLGTSWGAAYHVGEELGRLSLGNGIIWNKAKFTLKNEEKILLPLIKKFDPNEILWYKTIGVPGVPIQRRTISCLFTFDQTSIRISSVHVDNVGGAVHRMKQVAYVMQKLRSLTPTNYEIICGDFNTFDLLRTGKEKKLLQNTIGSEFSDASKDIDWSSDIYMIEFATSIKIFPWFIKKFNVHVRRRLDYIWVKNIIVNECKKIELYGSDHFPLTADLELPDNHS